MTDREILELILAKVTSLETRMDAIETRMDAIETRMDAIETRMDAIEARMDAIEARMDAIETRMDAIETRMDAIEAHMGTIEAHMDAQEARMDAQEAATASLREEVNRYNVILENTVNKCVQTMGEGIQLNAERFDRLDIDAVRLKVDTAYLIAKAAIEKIELMSA